MGRTFCRNQMNDPGENDSWTRRGTGAMGAPIAAKVERVIPGLNTRSGQRHLLPVCAELVEALFLFVAAKRKSGPSTRSEEHTSELQSLMRISYAVFCLNKKTT